MSEGVRKGGSEGGREGVRKGVSEEGRRERGGEGGRRGTEELESLFLSHTHTDTHTPVFSLGLYRRALCPLGPLMCPLGLPQNQQCALWVSHKTDNFPFVFSSHLNYLNL